MLKKHLLVTFLFLGFLTSNAQYYNSYSEVGIMTGAVFFKPDYGEAKDYENFIKNNGYSVGAFYYLSSVENYRDIREYLKVRLELSYLKADLEHYGKYVDPSKSSLFAKQLRGMYGSTQVVGFGTQIEFYPFKTDDYTRGIIFSPYLGFGPQINYYTSKAKSSLGTLGDPSITPVKYIGATRTGSDFAASITGSIGTRIKISDYHALTIEGRTQYFFSDWVDGLNPDDKIYTENKSYDWNIGINVGYVYYFY